MHGIICFYELERRCCSVHVSISFDVPQASVPYLDEGELLAHALVHAGTESQVGERLFLLLSLRPKPVRVELSSCNHDAAVRATRWWLDDGSSDVT